ncbi:hypothetical protein D7Z54_13090 [Salibacterium salarium]|uniref:YtpI-like protein n=1 Tax=Salibacterium salarium TaxID=284579 RepID=A0A428N3D5_9BACI|nr:YtpI family protein [Salibacterium salarium]RSL32953.1 hypothetical protein D7Z54_13090 [Salibacterium salarium]
MTPIFTIILIIALAMYVFYKIKAVRSKAPAAKKWIQTKANISVGLFMAAFGSILLFTGRETIDIVIGSIFLLLGAANIILGYRSYRIYLPYAAKEAEDQRMDS